MAINTTTRQTTAFTSGNNFAFAFKVYETFDVRVIRIQTSNGAESILNLNSDYTVTLNDDQNANPGGTVTLVSGGSPVNLGSGFNIVITSVVAPLQQTEITNQGGFFPEVINDVLDKAAILDQQQQSILDKTIRFPLTQTVGGLEITENAANRAGKVVQFDGSGDLTILGTVDGRDVSADGAKLDTIETNAKDDQTAAEIRALVESASDSNVFTDQDHSKLNGIEAGATGDLNASEVKALYEGNSNTNAFTDALVSKLNGIEAGATGDQSASEIRTLVGSASDSNVFTDNDHSKLDGIETGATADQTSGDIKTLLQSDKLTHLELANNSVTVSQIQDSQITAAKLDPAAVITASEQASATPNDTSFLTSAAADARFFNVSTGDTIKDGDTFPDNDTTIATTAAINDRIIDLVDDVGGFVPIANETSFPTANPDAENGTGTIVSVKAASADLTPSGTTVTIANGAGTGNTVTITGVPSVIPAGYGFLVETTATSGNGSANPPRQYTFHRLVPKATEVTTVAGKAVEIGRLGTADAVADMAILGTTDVVADMNMLATTDIVADMALLATTDVIADMALLAVPDVISDMNLLATSDNITAMDTCRDNISSITNASNNISSVNNFGDKYQIAANDPSTDGGGNALAVGDLYFNTSANELKVYNGSSWQAGVTATGNFATTTGNTFTGDNRYNDNVKLKLGTGSDLEIFHNGSHSYIKDTGTGRLILQSSQLCLQSTTGENFFIGNPDAAVELYYDHSKKFETTSTGIKVTGNLGINTAASSPNGQAVTLYASDFPQYRLINSTTGTGTSDGSKIFLNSDDLLISNEENGGEIKFKTNSSGSAERLKITAAGNLQIPADNKKLQIGAGQDLEILHTGSQSEINSLTGGLQIKDTGGFMRIRSNELKIQSTANENYIEADANGAVQIFYDNVKKLETYSAGVSITGTLTVNSGNIVGNDGAKLKLGTSDDLQIYHDGNHSYISDTGTGSLLIQASRTDLLNAAGNEFMITALQNGAVSLYYDGNVKLYTYSEGVGVAGNLNLGDSTSAATGRLRLGAGPDLYIYHDQSDSYITNVTGVLRINADNIYFKDKDSGDMFIKCIHDGAVELYHNNAIKLQTLSNGIQVTGDIFFNSATSKAIRLPDNKRIYFGDGDDFYIGSNGSYGEFVGEVFVYNHLNFYDNVRIRLGHGQDLDIFHNGSDSFIENDTGDLFIQNIGGSSDDIFIKAADNISLRVQGNDSGIEIYGDAQVSLYYDNSEKLQTASHGVKILAANDLRIEAGTWAGEYSGGIKIQADPSNSYFQYQGNLHFRSSNGSNRVVVSNTGDVLPGSNNAVDVGSNSNSWRNGYFQTLYGDGSNLTGISAGAQGGGSDEIFWCNGQTVTANYTIPNGKNAMSAGPITIANNVTVTIGSGETWTVV